VLWIFSFTLLQNNSGESERHAPRFRLISFAGTDQAGKRTRPGADLHTRPDVVIVPGNSNGNGDAHE
jgi:hypothetical protein